MQCYQTAAIDETIHVGAGAPYVLRFDVTNSDDPEIDLLNVTSARFEVMRASGEIETWTASIDQTGWTSTFIRVFHALDSDELPRVETIRISPVLVTATGELRAEPRTLKIASPFDPALTE